MKHISREDEKGRALTSGFRRFYVAKETKEKRSIYRHREEKQQQNIHILYRGGKILRRKSGTRAMRGRVGKPRNSLSYTHSLLVHIKTLLSKLQLYCIYNILYPPYHAFSFLAF